MSDVTIKYKGQSIATMDATGSKTLQTQGKYCEGDIGVEYVKPSGPSGTKQISITQNGTVTEDVTNYASAEISVNVQGGGSDNATPILNGTIAGVYTNSEVTSLRDNAISYCKSLTGINMPNVTSTGTNAFFNCDHVTSVSLPSLRSSGVYALSGMKALTAIALPALNGGTPNFFMSGDIALASADFGPSTNGLGGQAFASCSALRTVVLRRSSAIVTCATNTFNGTPFASGGAGGTIYIPKALYDHLGDGTVLDYKAATNWSVLDGYGTITWAQIEGSQYENYYADGTPIT